VPNLNASGRGDLYVHLDVKDPAKLTREQRKLMEQLRELLPVENEPRKRASSTRSKIISCKRGGALTQSVQQFLSIQRTAGVSSCLKKIYTSRPSAT
jgi:DnaJ-class molecular chaperone